MATEVMTSELITTENVDIEIVVEPLVKQMLSITEMIETFAKTSKILHAEMKVLTKDVNKLRMSKMSKKAKKVKEVDPNSPRKINALERPVPISDELAVFLDLTVGELHSRQTVTREINKYVKAKDLQNPENRRYILLESEDGLKLKALLRDPDQPLTFFNIQRYLKPHYIKVEDTTTKSVDVSEPVEKPVPVPVPVPVKKSSPDVVKDSDVVDESVQDEAPKKKIIRRVVKKVA